VDSLQIHLIGNEWVKQSTLLRTTQCKRGPLVIWTDTSGETSAGTDKLEEAIEKPCSDALAHTLEVCKGIPPDQQVPYCQGQS
jgi:thiamine monophosphate kinase